MNLTINLEIIIAALAFAVSLPTAFATYIQAKKTEEALDQQQNFSQANAILHFTQEYFSLVQQYGEPSAAAMQNDQWTQKYWALQSTEFYFFHHGVIPKMMYALWMVDMVDMYAMLPGAWESHKVFLKRYQLYDDMRDFFTGIHQIAEKFNDEDERYKRHNEVHTYVFQWIDDNQASTLS